MYNLNKRGLIGKDKTITNIRVHNRRKVGDRDSPTMWSHCDLSELVIKVKRLVLQWVTTMGQNPEY